MTPVYLIDFETRSLADIKLGGRVYWLDPTTDVVCMAWRTADGACSGVWLPGDPCPLPAGATVAAHNMMGFDRFGFDRLGWGPYTLIDTAELARRAGLPGKLDELGKRLLGVPKDTAGNRVTMALSLSPVTGDTFDRKTGALIRRGVPEDLKAPLKEYARACKEAGAWVPIPPVVLDRVIAYCQADVEIMAGAWEELEPWLEVDADVSAAERAVNNRGVPFDVELARRLLEEDARNAEETIAREAEALGVTPAELREVAMSPAKFVQATGASDAQANTVRALIASDARDPEAAAYAKARQALATIARGKLEAGLRREINGRLYDAARYYGTHTGRWSGQGMQHQNMPRPPKEFEKLTSAEIEALAQRVLDGGRATPGEIDVLLRAVIYASEGQVLVVCDFSAVENRCLAFNAGDLPELDRITRGVDPYKTLATEIYRVAYDGVQSYQRSAGKIGVLACGYGGGARALTNMAEAMGVDLAGAGVTAAEIVRAWRAQHPTIVKFWYVVERAFCAAVRGREAWAGRYQFVPADDGSAVAAILPSGRPIVYNAPELQRDGRRTAITFHGTKSGREYTYGGKLVENLTQAECRDLMAEALVRVENGPAWLRPVMHVHDEIVCLAPEEKSKEALALLERTMVELPDWAEGFPIGADGYVSRRYKK